MIREAEVNRAFRVVYDTLAKVGEPVNTPEYAKLVTDLFGGAWIASGRNSLIKYLSLGVVEWLSDLSREGEKHEMSEVRP